MRIREIYFYIASFLMIVFGIFMIVLYSTGVSTLENQQKRTAIELTSTQIVENAKRDFYQKMTEIAPTETPVPHSEESNCTVTTRIYGENVSADINMTFVGEKSFASCIEWLRLSDRSKVKNGVSFTTFLNETYVFGTQQSYCKIDVAESDIYIVLSSDNEKVGKLYCEQQGIFTTIDA